MSATVHPVVLSVRSSIADASRHDHLQLASFLPGLYLTELGDLAITGRQVTNSTEKEPDLELQASIDRQLEIMECFMPLRVLPYPLVFGWEIFFPEPHRLASCLNNHTDVSQELIGFSARIPLLTPCFSCVTSGDVKVAVRGCVDK
ncbi:hypothetical protein VFPPC_16775 [Pochonia chlamydosporia 170]|uniref:Uncharacterized protein n=1 Tax=Pochonia chlamydosporia 170 TaxID=1380566 RepID=A0A179F417_METCM|nr:hypothetical protein VFPPC_16775 [Pochonia chlamydosporia 170]OAQ60152.1 hypothetical protein VFPPC_16775 [Pochonia chlamydosporia 170]